MTVLYVLIIFAISSCLNFYKIIKTSIYEKIKLINKSEGGKYYNIKFVYIGILLTIIAFIIMILYYKENSNIYFLSVLICIIGSTSISYGIW